ncbi:hypothetical protein GE09DRAFT_1065165 [Coniochaeta sp. 2T2.1]|nr:hypothetical protein GE09DRAFT_1065165 [Coniochaeta sp. 2T2.1]
MRDVTILSSPILDLSVANPNRLTHPVHAADAMAAYTRVRSTFGSSALRPILTDLVKYFPGPEVETDEEQLETIRNSLHTVYHASCTCGMGRCDMGYGIYANANGFDEEMCGMVKGLHSSDVMVLIDS